MRTFMDRNIRLTISGLHVGDSGDDNIETIVNAQYFDKGRSRFVIYEEKKDGFREPVKSRIKFRDGCLEITRQGTVNTNMVFEENRKNVTSYRMPYGDILLGIDTHSMELSESGKQILIKVNYSLEINGEHQADSYIVIKIENR